MKLNKSLSLIIAIIFLSQSMAYGVSGKSSTLRPPSHFSKTTEEFINKRGLEEALREELKNMSSSDRTEIIDAGLDELDRIANADDAKRIIEEIFEDDGFVINVEEREKWDIESLSQSIHLTAIYIKKGDKKVGVWRFYPDPHASSQIISHSTGFESNLTRRGYFALLLRWVSANSYFSKYAGWKIKLDESVHSGAAKAWWRSGFDVKIAEIDGKKNKIIKNAGEIKQGKHYSITGTFLTWGEKQLSSSHPYYQAILKEFVTGKNHPARIEKNAEDNNPENYKLIWDAITRLAGDLRDKAVVELGARCGAMVHLLREQGIDAFGVEMEPIFVEFANKQGVPLVLANLATLPENITDKPISLTFSRWVLDDLGTLEEGGASNILLHRSLNHEERLKALKAISDLTPPGAWSIHATYYRIPFSDDEIRDAGFEIVEINKERNFMALKKLPVAQELNKIEDLKETQSFL
jgi:hypothetical protein